MPESRPGPGGPDMMTVTGIHDKGHWDAPGTPVPGALLYDCILPKAVSELDGQTPYWPGSPYGGNDHNSMQDGVRHNWHVWHGDQARRFGEKPQMDRSPSGVFYWHYDKDTGRFISEFGMHASPVLETLRRCIPKDQLYHHSEAMDHHNKDEPKNKGDHLMATVTEIPSTLEEYIDFSMIAQAEGLKYGVEHFRRRTPHCSGALIWQLNDCWPGLSWSVIEYWVREATKEVSGDYIEPRPLREDITETTVVSMQDLFCLFPPGKHLQFGGNGKKRG